MDRKKYKFYTLGNSAVYNNTNKALIYECTLTLLPSLNIIENNNSELIQNLVNSIADRDRNYIDEFVKCYGGKLIKISSGIEYTYDKRNSVFDQTELMKKYSEGTKFDNSEPAITLYLVNTNRTYTNQTSRNVWTAVERKLESNGKFTYLKYRGLLGFNIETFITDFVESSGHGGGSIYIKTEKRVQLGKRQAVVYTKDRKQYVLYKKNYVTLKEARKLIKSK